MSDEDNLFSRWSSRKRAVAKEEAAQETVPAAGDDKVEPVAGKPLPEPEESEDEILARLGLPSPESLGPGDDYTGFMQSGVPEFLRRRALRRLWRSNPVLANVDGLNDYDEDFTSPEETMKVLKTAYQVGRGFLRDPEETSEETGVEDSQEGGAGGETVETAASEDQADTTGPADSQEMQARAETSAKDAPAATQATSEPAPARPRRMRFQT